ncbi:hypothetical protein [Paraflavitalea pollutisoli]|uniref:hypothetical protein n=1 Tax=Paraflavitalea pollutisoli TaxID=3034143 RepID=UPI0023EDDA7E|nr:hypothetical protein [Paraflavitalea sp. H1-2-19X]
MTCIRNVTNHFHGTKVGGIANSISRIPIAIKAFVAVGMPARSQFKQTIFYNILLSMCTSFVINKNENHVYD